MPDGVLIALIGAGSAIIGNLIANWSRSKKEATERAVRQQNLDDRLDSLEKKVDEHNGYAKRFVEIEKGIVRIDTKLENIEKRIK